MAREAVVNDALVGFRWQSSRDIETTSGSRSILTWSLSTASRSSRSCWPA